MVERWRSMSVAEKGDLVETMCRDCDELAHSGIRSREPAVSPERERWLLMMRRYGRAFTLRVLGSEPSRVD